MNKAVFLLTLAHAQLCTDDTYYRNEWPKEWTPEPTYRMNDCVYFPDEYGTGSSTTRTWIEENLARLATIKRLKRAFEKAEIEEYLSRRSNEEGDSFITVNYTAIPKGATNRNFQGYYQDGTYRIVTRYDGKMRLEINQTLHVPDMQTDFYYMQWGQTIDNSRYNGTHQHYEGW